MGTLSKQTKTVIWTILNAIYIFSLKGHWQQKISTFNIKLFDLNKQNVVVCCNKNYCNTFLNVAKMMTVTSCVGKHMTSLSFLTLVLPFRWLIFRNFFHEVNIAIKQQQWRNTVRPHLNSDHFAWHVTS